jgi:hypothetical protein
MRYVDGGGGFEGGRSRWSLWSQDSFLCIASRGSVLSIGSVGSAASAFSIGSFASIGSGLSSMSRSSLMSHRSVDATMSQASGPVPPAAILAGVGAAAALVATVARALGGRKG